MAAILKNYHMLLVGGASLLRMRIDSRCARGGVWGNCKKIDKSTASLHCIFFLRNNDVPYMHFASTT